MKILDERKRNIGHNKSIEIDIKEKLVKAANNGENYKLLARQMDINVGTASNMVRRVKKKEMALFNCPKKVAIIKKWMRK